MFKWSVIEVLALISSSTTLISSTQDRASADKRLLVHCQGRVVFGHVVYLVMRIWLLWSGHAVACVGRLQSWVEWW